MEEGSPLRWEMHLRGGMQIFGKAITPDAQASNKKGILPDQQRLGAGRQMEEEPTLCWAVHLPGGRQIFGKTITPDAEAGNKKGISPDQQ